MYVRHYWCEYRVCYYDRRVEITPIIAAAEIAITAASTSIILLKMITVRQTPKAMTSSGLTNHTIINHSKVLFCNELNLEITFYLINHLYIALLD